MFYHILCCIVLFIIILFINKTHLVSIVEYFVFVFEIIRSIFLRFYLWGVIYHHVYTILGYQSIPKVLIKTRTTTVVF